MYLDERGGSRVATLLYLLVAILVFYVLFKVIPPYMAYYSMDDEVSQEIGMSSINPDEVIVKDLYEKAQELGLPIDQQDIKLTRDAASVTIDIQWVTEVDFGYGFKRDFAFEVKTSAKEKAESS
jgi:hypothetical protein